MAKRLWQVQTTGNYRDLCFAVVAQACDDYKNALILKKRQPESHGESRKSRDGNFLYIDADDTIAECEYFLREDIDLWADMDGEWLIQAIRESVKSDQGETEVIPDEQADL